MIRMLPEGANRDAFVSLALSPCRHSGGRIWRWPNVFSSKSSNGMWQGRILPELEEQLESSRISGSASLRNPPNLPPDSSEQPTPPVKEAKKGKRIEKGRRNKINMRLVGDPRIRNLTPNCNLARILVTNHTLLVRDYGLLNLKPRNYMDHANPHPGNLFAGTSTRVRVVQYKGKSLNTGFIA